MLEVIVFFGQRALKVRLRISVNHDFKKHTTDESQLRIWPTKDCIEEICISEIHTQKNQVSSKCYDVSFINIDLLLKVKLLIQWLLNIHC